MPERNWYDNVMGFFGQDAEGVISGRKPSEVSGKVEAHFGDFLAGRSQSELDSAYDTMQTTKRRKKGREYLDESGYTATELKLDPDKTSVGAVQSAIRLLEERKGEIRRNDEFKKSLAPTQMTLAHATAQSNQTNQRMLANDARNHQLQLMQFADNKDQRVAELEYQKSRDRKSDMQYNERMEMLDRKDRKTAMSSIAAGLASLGAAFAM
jgi:hypothetical protein